MPMQASEAAAALDRRLTRLQRTARKVERSFDDGSLTRTDLEALYEGLFIGAVVAFERFIESLFTGIVLNRVVYAGGRIVPRIDVRSAGVLEPLLNAGRSYADWLPYHETEKKANVYLRGGRPFTDVGATEKQRMDRWLWTRNAIAHASKHSVRVFTDNVIAGTPLPPRERTPAGFLRSELRPGVTRFENALDEMRGVAATLCR